MFCFSYIGSPLSVVLNTCRAGTPLQGTGHLCKMQWFWGYWGRPACHLYALLYLWFYEAHGYLPFVRESICFTIASNLPLHYSDSEHWAFLVSGWHVKKLSCILFVESRYLINCSCGLWSFLSKFLCTVCSLGICLRMNVLVWKLWDEVLMYALANLFCILKKHELLDKHWTFPHALNFSSFSFKDNNMHWHNSKKQPSHLSNSSS